MIGSGGNLSAREPGSDQCWITATGTWLDRLEPAEFSLIGIPDGGLRGGHPAASSEWRLHTETFARRLDVNAIVHLHPPHRAGSPHRTAHHRPGLLPARGRYGPLRLARHHRACDGGSRGRRRKRAVNLEEAARAMYAALQLTGGDPTRVPQVPAAFLAAVGPDANDPA